MMLADIVGYSTMMGADAAGTLATLRAFQSEILGPCVAGQRGWIVKSLGDGWLVEFSSAIAAVNCAMQVQDRLSEDQAIRLRIGVHVGDVMHQEGDIFGDGVNVAARLERMAEPGGVAISEMAYASLDGTMRPSFDDAGEHSLKNIERPIRVWTRRTAQTVAPVAAATDASSGVQQNGFPRLSVVPVTTSDIRLEVQELADAITNDLGLCFRSLGWLDCAIAETPKDHAYQLRSQLRSRGDRLRLQVQLSGPDDAFLWSEKMDSDLDDSFDWQDTVSEEITSNVIGFVFDTEIARLSQIPRDERTAVQCFLHGLLRRGRMTEDHFIEGLTDFGLAIEKDPARVEAYAEAIFFVMGGRTMKLKRLSEFSERHDRWMEQAIPLAARSPALDLCLATSQFFKDGAIAPLKAKIADVLRRAPFDVKILAFSGWGSLWSGDTQTALDCFQKVDRLARFSPYASIVNGGLALARFQTGDTSGALEMALKGIEQSPEYSAPVLVKAAALAELGRQSEAEATMRFALENFGHESISKWKAINDYGGSPGGQRYFAAMRKAGMPE